MKEAWIIAIVVYLLFCVGLWVHSIRNGVELELSDREKVLGAIKERGMTVTELAQRVGYSRTHLRYVLSGERKMSDALKGRLFELLKLA